MYSLEGDPGCPTIVFSLDRIGSHLPFADKSRARHGAPAFLYTRNSARLTGQISPVALIRDPTEYLDLQNEHKITNKRLRCPITYPLNSYLIQISIGFVTSPTLGCQ